VDGADADLDRPVGALRSFSASAWRFARVAAAGFVVVAAVVLVPRWLAELDASPGVPSAAGE
jgi:hypothetical protein